MYLYCYRCGRAEKEGGLAVVVLAAVVVQLQRRRRPIVFFFFFFNCYHRRAHSPHGRFNRHRAVDNVGT